MSLDYNTSRTVSGVRRGACAAWGVSGFLVLFYILASCRALIPGLCATQAAMDAHCGPTGGSTPAPAGICCYMPPDDDGSSAPAPDPVTPEQSRCAFCNLLIAKTDPPLFFTAPLPAPAHFAGAIPVAEQFVGAFSRGAAPNRAPPA
ncbi:MAG: hypothetical protein KF886_09845 [Candidatus Hydrogenedentes bacterium]|nr:hypothetical protein [Candidatus Hydrogenedentota bacterium]